MIVCLDHDGDTRRFMLRAAQMGLTSNEYVYIMPDYVRDQNRSELWLQYNDNNEVLKDSRDEEAKAAFRPMLMVTKFVALLNNFSWK